MLGAAPPALAQKPGTFLDDLGTTDVLWISAAELRLRLQDLLEARTAPACDWAAPLAPGLVHRVIFRPQAPAALINAFHLDLWQPKLALTLAKAGPAVLARQKIEAIAKRLAAERKWTPLAGVNGGFWEPNDRPVGALAGEGQIYRASDHQWTFLLGAGGEPYLGPVTFRRVVRIGAGAIALRGLNAAAPTLGAHLFTAAFGPQTPPLSNALEAVRLDFEPGAPMRINAPAKARVAQRRSGPGPFELQSAQGWLVFLPGAEEALQDAEPFALDAEAVLEIACDALSGPVDLALSAGPVLVRDGAIALGDPSKANEAARLEGGWLEARTGLGLSANRRRLILATVDSSRFGLSKGVTLAGLAEELIRQGACEGLNLDGGSSTVAWADEGLASRPSGLTGSRPISNALFVCQIGPAGALP